MPEDEKTKNAEAPDKAPAETPAGAAPKEKGLAPKLFFMVMGTFLVVMVGAGFLLAYLIVPSRLAARAPPPAAPSPSTTNSTEVLPPHPTSEPAPPVEKTSHEGGKEASKKVDEFLISELLVNITGTRGSRFIKLSIFFDAPPEVLGELEAQRPKIIDMISEIVSTRTMEEITAPTARGELRTQILTTANTLVKRGAIRSIYFTDFMVQ